MKKIIFIFIILLITISDSHSQLIKKLGFKTGPVMFWQYGDNSHDRNGFGYGFDFGMFTVIKGYKKLSFVIELDYADKGTAKGEPGNTGVRPFGYPDSYTDFNNRYQYITLGGFIKFNSTKKDYGFYTIAGFRLDMMVNNYYTGYANTVFKPAANHFEFGGTIGIGLATTFGLLFEIQYNPNFTPIFKYNLYNNDVKFYNASVNLLTGYQF